MTRESTTRGGLVLVAHSEIVAPYWIGERAENLEKRGARLGEKSKTRTFKNPRCVTRLQRKGARRGGRPVSMLFSR
jgi:hypothetical protein